MIWQLIFYKAPDASAVDGFEVGFFDSLDEAAAVKADYAALPGFRDAPEGTWTLVGHAVSGPADGLVWRVVGHSWSEAGDERDVIMSPVFADRADADACLAALSSRCPRDMLEVTRIRINQRLWPEGFDSQ